MIEGLEESHKIIKIYFLPVALHVSTVSYLPNSYVLQQNKGLALLQ